MCDYAKAALVYQLGKDYHDVAQHLKALRDTPDDAGSIESHRAAATGWFNHVFVLWIGRFIDEDVLQAVASKTAAQLYVAHVLPLDYAIRAEKHGEIRPMGQHPVEQFWMAFAQGQLLIPKDPTAELATVPQVVLQ